MDCPFFLQSVVLCLLLGAMFFVYYVNKESLLPEEEMSKLEEEGKNRTIGRILTILLETERYRVEGKKPDIELARRIYDLLSDL